MKEPSEYTTDQMNRQLREYLYDRDVVEFAQNRGWDVVFPQLGESQLDVDSFAQLEDVNKRLTMFRRYCTTMDWQLPEVVMKPSPSGEEGHFHVFLRVRWKDGSPVEFSHAERIAWQAALGSDWKRELLNMVRCQNEFENPTRLFVKALNG